MSILLGLLFIVEIVIALLMVGVVMLQPPKDPSGGMGSAFGGGFGEEVFGGRTGNVLTRATVVLGVLLILNSLAITMLMRGKVSDSSLTTSALSAEAPAEAPVEQAPLAPVMPTAPAMPAQ